MGKNHYIHRGIEDILEYGHPLDVPSTIDEKLLARAIVREDHREYCAGAVLNDIIMMPLTQADVDKARAIIDQTSDATISEKLKPALDKYRWYKQHEPALAKQSLKGQKVRPQASIEITHATLERPFDDKYPGEFAPIPTPEPKHLTLSQEREAQLILACFCFILLISLFSCAGQIVK